MNWLYAFILLISGTAVQANQGEMFIFDTPEQEKIFNKLSHEIRCLVCQNQTLSDSNAGLASDLRKEIYSMVQDGKTEEEIISFLVERYGDYVLYRPPLKPMTWLLWFGPALVLVAGLYIVKRFLRGQEAKPGLDELSDEEIERVKNLQSEAHSHTYNVSNNKHKFDGAAK